MSASTIPQVGPITMCVNSTTRTPRSGCGAEPFAGVLTLPPRQPGGQRFVEVTAAQPIPGDRERPVEQVAHRERLGATDGGPGTRESLRAIAQADFTGDDGPHGAFGLKGTLS
jgi:hypothetical protein